MSVGAATTDRTAPSGLARVRTPGALVAVLILLSLALHYVWLARFRLDYVTEWDESGYLQFALSNFDALRDGGPLEFAKTVGGRGTYGPLLPLVTSLAYPIIGRGIFEGLLVVPLFFAGLVAAVFGLARQLVSPRWAVVAAATVATIPAVIDYTRLFHFALPATACMTAALWALLRSDGLRRPGWAAAFGLLVGLTFLARTMTVAYAPALALAAGAQLLAGRTDLGLRLRHLAIAVAATLLVAGPWYVRNARTVYDNLVGGGYGERATQYGPGYPLASWGYWTKELRVDLDHLGLPLAAVLLLCFGIALVFAIANGRRIRPRYPLSARGAGVAGLALVVVQGYVVLTSARNQGTGFALPWLPSLVVLGVVAAASIPARAVRGVLAVALLVTALTTGLSKSGWVESLAEARRASVPGLGSVVVTDGTGIIQREVAGAGYAIDPVSRPLPAMHKEWLPLARDVIGWSIRYAQSRGTPLHITLGTDDLIFSNWRLILAAQLWDHRFQPVDYLNAYPDGDTVAAYRRQLLSPQPENALVVFDPPPYSKISRGKVEAAARSLGFAPVKSFVMPDGRMLWIWWRGEGQKA